ncbi:hypothetical protein [Methylobacter sp. YRD-M1]|uniref:hypothetical protein n=1 Tax=Methylobacter sp. YRD-M1 TaxID=2911520 RepID=UPI00227D1190|nr:hypothetical protein [Methylobacter sp. YRD-M1]WAK02903.1 hypothetical protein LZ558_03710 [Methylobacter sp. YRD-M1]
MKRTSFSGWLSQALWLIGREPLVWIGYMLVIGLLLGVGRVSLVLGVFLSVTSLFVGVGVAKYTDLKRSAGHSASLYWAISKSLPLAVLAALSIVLCWFVFRLATNIYSEEWEKIAQFFYYWELTPENMDDKSLRQLAGWFYSSAIVALIFVLLMLTTFASWFSYPLMLFKNYTWSQAKEQGNKAVARHLGAIYKLLGFVFAAVFIGGGMMPLLTPVLYALVSTLMYVSYQTIFELG